MHENMHLKVKIYKKKYSFKLSILVYINLMIKSKEKHVNYIKQTYAYT